jgi:hypothetical protein
MNDQLDGALAVLANCREERSLGELEADVWSAVRRQEPRRSVAAPLRWAAVGGALGLGALAGGMSVAAERGDSEVAAFAVNAPLAPSSLLAGPN